MWLLGLFHVFFFNVVHMYCVTVLSVSYRIMIFEVARYVGDMMVLGQENNTSIWWKLAKLEGGNLSLGERNPRFPTLCTYETLVLVRQLSV